MIDKGRIPKELLAILEENIKGRIDDIIFPPPVFDAMKGEVISYDAENKVLVNRFPILNEHLNPYGGMQGGIVSAAVDNTIGPLSMLVSPPNFTRYMEMKYAKVVTPDLGYIYVTARFIEKKKRQLFFEATVEDKDGNKLASAKSTHWVID
ncbi:PaaI family thioesterase [Amphritea sp.]|uniref:PaaI family thioesterase n=1 Tax=Amphritea sp. TaxID=1872502 RepID=UPI0025B82519|nr:PaaI family thioesterase [Amphritea sp.]